MFYPFYIYAFFINLVRGNTVFIGFVHSLASYLISKGSSVEIKAVWSDLYPFDLGAAM